MSIAAGPSPPAAAVAPAPATRWTRDLPFAPDLYRSIGIVVAVVTGLCLLALLTNLPPGWMIAGLVPAAAISAAAGLLWPATLSAVAWIVILAIPAWLLLGL